MPLGFLKCDGAGLRASLLVGTSAGLLTLSHTWFFYDASDVVVDVEFERQGD